jgi:uncharacterized protein YneF (UPF0154 family)
MARRDNPFDDWDWLGIFQHDSRPAEGCLRFLPTLLVLSLVLGILVAPVWTAYNIGRKTFREKPWVMLGAALAITLITVVVDLLAVGVGVFHLLTLIFSPAVAHNPFITAAMLLAIVMLVVIVGAYFAGRRELHRANLLVNRMVGDAIAEHISRYRRGSYSPQATRR